LSIYNEYFGFKEAPFSLTPDPEFLFLSSVHREALAYLRYGLREKKGFVLITGEVGSGKTTLLRSLLKDVHREIRTALIINPRVEFAELMHAIFTDLEVDLEGPLTTKTEQLDAFYEYLLEQHEVGRNVVLIFDEAQHLSLPLLEEIRLLSNFETPKEKLLQIIFVGQPELRQKLALPQLRQLRQRISVRYHINPLNMQEIAEYIKHRLQVAGRNDSELFSPKAIDAIYEFSGGTPRLVNVICDAALLAGFADGKDRIDAALMQETLKEHHLYDQGVPDTQPAVAPTQPAPAAADTELLFDLAKTVLRLQGEVTERSSELAGAMDRLRQQTEAAQSAVPRDLLEQVSQAAELLTGCAEQIDSQQRRIAPKLETLDDVLSTLTACAEQTRSFLDRLGCEDNGAEKETDSADNDSGAIERRLRLHCSQCDGAHYVEGTFCRHCWDHIRRLKMNGMLDA